MELDSTETLLVFATFRIEILKDSVVTIPV